MSSLSSCLFKVSLTSHKPYVTTSPTQNWVSDFRALNSISLLAKLKEISQPLNASQQVSALPLNLTLLYYLLKSKNSTEQSSWSLLGWLCSLTACCFLQTLHNPGLPSSPTHNSLRGNTAWSPRSSSEIWMQASLVPQPLHSACLYYQCHGNVA